MTSTNSHTEQAPQTETCRAVVFAIANHWLALPMNAVLKVVPRAVAQTDCSGQQSIVYLDNRPLTLLNLHHCLSFIPGNTTLGNTIPGNRASSDNASRQLLLIARLQNHPQWAIPVDQPPTLLELPLSTVQLLPSAYRQSIQNLADHVAVLTDPHGIQTILLLNLKQADAICRQHCSHLHRN